MYTYIISCNLIFLFYDNFENNCIFIFIITQKFRVGGILTIGELLYGIESIRVFLDPEGKVLWNQCCPSVLLSIVTTFSQKRLSKDFSCWTLTLEVGPIRSSVRSSDSPEFFSKTADWIFMIFCHQVRGQYRIENDEARWISPCINFGRFNTDTKSFGQFKFRTHFCPKFLFFNEKLKKILVP